MQLYCDQKRLAAALKAVLPAVPSRPLVVTDAGLVLSAAEGMLLSSTDGHPSAGSPPRVLAVAGHCLEVAATDREIAIQCRMGAHVAQPGEVVLPARTITDLVALLDVASPPSPANDESIISGVTPTASSSGPQPAGAMTPLDEIMLVLL